MRDCQYLFQTDTLSLDTDRVPNSFPRVVGFADGIKSFSCTRRGNICWQALSLPTLRGLSEHGRPFLFCRSLVRTYIRQSKRDGDWKWKFITAHSLTRGVFLLLSSSSCVLKCVPKMGWVYVHEGKYEKAKQQYVVFLLILKCKNKKGNIIPMSL